MRLQDYFEFPADSLSLSLSLSLPLFLLLSLYAGNAPRYALPLSLSFLATYDPLLLNPLATYSNLPISKLYHPKKYLGTYVGTT